jgi:hypothetical protein
MHPLIRHATLVLAASLAAMDATAAESSSRPLPGAPRLGAPFVTKLDWDTRSLAIADINADGRNDVALLNNDTGRIELLYQRDPSSPPALGKNRPHRRDRWTPILEDSPFHVEKLPGDAAMHALALGDLNNDGLPDIAYTSERNGLTLILQGPVAGQWHPPIKDKSRTPHTGPHTLRIARLHGADKPPTLVQLTQEGIALYQLADARGDKNAPLPLRLPSPQYYRTDTTSNTRLIVQALRAPDATAIGTYTPNANNTATLRYRIPAADGAYGPEITHHFPTPTLPDTDTPLSLRPVPIFATIDARQRLVSTLQLQPDPRPLLNSGSDATSHQTYALPTPATHLGQALLFPLNATGHPHLIVADPKASKLHIYSPEPKTGDYREPAEYPTLANLTTLAPVPVPAAAAAKETPLPALFLHSEKDSTLAIVRFPNGKPAPPVPIALPEGNTPRHLATHPALAIVHMHDDKDKWTLQRILHTPGGTLQFTPVTAPESSRRDVTNIRIDDINGDGLPDILAHIDREPMRIWLQTPDGKFTETARHNPHRKNHLVPALTPADLTLAPDPASPNAPPLILVTTPGNIHMLQFDKNGELTLRHQANARRPSDRLRAPQLITHDGTPTLITYNETDASLEIFTPDPDGTYRTRQNIATESMSPLQSWLQTHPGESTPRLLYHARDRIIQIPTAHRGTHVRQTPIYETDLTNFTPRTLHTIPLSPVGTPHILLHDPRSHIVEIIAPPASPSGQWTSMMHFTLYDENPHYHGRRNSAAQPRELQTADVTGDGLPDLLLLMHDRLFVYPQTGN